MSNLNIYIYSYSQRHGVHRGVNNIEHNKEGDWCQLTFTNSPVSAEPSKPSCAFSRGASVLQPHFSSSAAVPTLAHQHLGLKGSRSLSLLNPNAGEPVLAQPLRPAAISASVFPLEPLGPVAHDAIASLFAAPLASVMALSVELPRSSGMITATAPPRSFAVLLGLPRVSQEASSPASLAAESAIMSAVAPQHMCCLVRVVVVEEWRERTDFVLFEPIHF